MIGETILERYRVEERLGEGGMGEVFLARHSTLSIPVAIKVILRSRVEHVGRFEREAMAMARVRHVNVVSIIDFGFHLGSPCIVMEYIEGESLAVRMARECYVPWPAAFEIGAQVLEGLAAVHAAGLVHRDVKPENVMLSAGRPEVAKVVDFGIAKVDDASRRLTATGVMVGTPAYMPPEQLAAAQVSPGSDIYALATTVWEMVAGALPFGDTVSGLSKKLTQRPAAPSPPLSHPQLSPRAKDILSAMLDPNVASRPSDASACADAMRESVREHRRAPSAAATPPPSASRRTMEWRTPAGDLTRGDKAPRRPTDPISSPPAVAAPAVAPSRPGTSVWSRMPRPSLTYSQGKGGKPRQTWDDPESIESTSSVAAPIQPLEIAAPPGPDAGPLVVVARLPSAALAKPDQRRWLAQRLNRGGRGYTLGGNFWLVAEPCMAASEAEVNERLTDLRTTLTDRFGAMVRLVGERAPSDFSLSPAALTGASPMPELVTSLIAKVSAG